MSISTLYNTVVSKFEENPYILGSMERDVVHGHITDLYKNAISLRYTQVDINACITIFVRRRLMDFAKNANHKQFNEFILLNDMSDACAEHYAAHLDIIKNVSTIDGAPRYKKYLPYFTYIMNMITKLRENDYAYWNRLFSDPTLDAPTKMAYMGILHSAAYIAIHKTVRNSSGRIIFGLIDKSYLMYNFLLIVKGKLLEQGMTGLIGDIDVNINNLSAEINSSTSTSSFRIINSEIQHPLSAVAAAQVNNTIDRTSTRMPSPASASNNAIPVATVLDDDIKTYTDTLRMLHKKIIQKYGHSRISETLTIDEIWEKELKVASSNDFACVIAYDTEGKLQKKYYANKYLEGALSTVSNETENCVVCMNDVPSGTAITCGCSTQKTDDRSIVSCRGVMCASCAVTWYAKHETKPTCPTCRGEYIPIKARV